MAESVINLANSYSVVDLTEDSGLPRRAAEALQQVRVADAPACTMMR